VGVNELYDDARERLLNAQLNWPTLSLRLLAFTGNPETSFNASHLIQSSIGTPYAVSQPIINPLTGVGGYARSSAARFIAVPIGSDVTFFALAEDNITPTSRRLIAYLADLTMLPFTPNGGDYLVKPDWLFGQGWFRA
jgi:hypothetical protein